MKPGILFPYVHRDRDRHGNVRVYYRRRLGEPKIRLRERLGTPEFAAEYAAAHARAQAGPITHSLSKPKAGTLRWLCGAYFGSTEFQHLEASTQKNATPHSGKLSGGAHLAELSRIVC